MRARGATSSITALSVQRSPSLPRRPRAFEQVVDHIRAQLADGGLKSGDRLPAERTLAEQMQVSRGAVREALRTLEVSGVLRFEPGASGGAYLRRGNPSAVASSIGDLLILRDVTLQELTEARLWIEISVVRSACRRSTEHELRALEENIDLAERLMKAGRLEEKVAANLEFHNVLALATRNPVLVLVMELLIKLLQRFSQAVPPESRKIHIAWRRRFLRRLRARDEEGAVAVMQEHLMRVHRRYLKHLRESGAHTARVDRK